MDRIRELNRHSREIFRQIREGVPPRPRPDTGGLSRNYVIEEHSASGTEAGHTSLKSDFHPPDGMIGNRMCQDRAASAKTRLRAMRLLPLAFRLARIWVDVEMWEVAASYVETRAVPAAEQIGDREQLDGDRIDLIQHHPPKPAARSAPASRVGCCIYRQRIWP